MASSARRLKFRTCISLGEAAVPAALLESLSLIGPEGYVKEHIAALEAAGVTLLDVQPVGPDPMGDVARVKELVS